MKKIEHPGDYCCVKAVSSYVTICMYEQKKDCVQRKHRRSDLSLFKSLQKDFSYGKESALLIKRIYRNAKKIRTTL